MESDAQRIIEHDDDSKFLHDCGVGRYDHEQGVRFHLERAEVLKEQIRREVEEFRSR